MKYQPLTIMLMAAGLTFSACGNKQQDDKSTQSDSTETATADPAADDEEEFEVPTRGIDTIRSDWKRKTLKVEAKTPSIKDFTLAFCKAYPQCETNQALRDFLQSADASKDEYQIVLPTRDGEHEIAYDIECNPRNGYIRSMGEVETDRFTYTCFWNRKNGHKLFAAFMDECWETVDWDQCLIVFYDFDPATGTMTPEPSLTEMIEERMKQFSLCYYINLPDEGKDIEVIGVDSEEEDACATETFNLKWNGTSFDWEE